MNRTDALDTLMHPSGDMMTKVALCIFYHLSSCASLLFSRCQTISHDTSPVASLPCMIFNQVFRESEACWDTEENISLINAFARLLAGNT